MSKKPNPLMIGSARIDITPSGPEPLLGYFNERISTSVLDPLHCRMLGLRLDENRILIVQIDTCIIPTDFARALRREIASNTPFKSREILLNASHTHTAPALTGFFRTRMSGNYRSFLLDRILRAAVLLASGDPAGSPGPNVHTDHEAEQWKPCTVYGGLTEYRGLAFNRRWVMKGGEVVTNPPKRSPDRERPEGGVDRTCGIVVFKTNGGPDVMLVNISNHADTIGGTEISADWPGIMEREIEAGSGKPAVVLPLIAPQGNINHFDFDLPEEQASYSEARRIGKAYAGVVLRLIRDMERVDVDTIGAEMRTVVIGPREIEPSELKRSEERAEKRAASTVSAGGESDLTACGLARGNEEVERELARELLLFNNAKKPRYEVPLQVIRIGNMRICAIPGEPFAEIGMELRNAVPGVKVLPVALSNGYFGYVPLERSFTGGGYEVRPGRMNCLERTAGTLILRELKKMLS